MYRYLFLIGLLFMLACGTPNPIEKKDKEDNKTKPIEEKEREEDKPLPQPFNPYGLVYNDSSLEVAKANMDALQSYWRHCLLHNEDFKLEQDLYIYPNGENFFLLVKRDTINLSGPGQLRFHTSFAAPIDFNRRYNGFIEVTNSGAISVENFSVRGAPYSMYFDINPAKFINDTCVQLLSHRPDYFKQLRRGEATYAMIKKRLKTPVNHISRFDPKQKQIYLKAPIKQFPKKPLQKGDTVYLATSFHNKPVVEATIAKYGQRLRSNFKPAFIHKRGNTDGYIKVKKVKIKDIPKGITFKASIPITVEDSYIAPFYSGINGFDQLSKAPVIVRNTLIDTTGYKVDFNVENGSGNLGHGMYIGSNIPIELYNCTIKKSGGLSLRHDQTNNNREVTPGSYSIIKNCDLSEGWSLLSPLMKTIVDSSSFRRLSMGKESQLSNSRILIRLDDRKDVSLDVKGSFYNNHIGHLRLSKDIKYNLSFQKCQFSGTRLSAIINASNSTINFKDCFTIFEDVERQTFILITGNNNSITLDGLYYKGEQFYKADKKFAYKDRNKTNKVILKNPPRNSRWVK